MRRIHHCLAFGFLEDVIEHEIASRCGDFSDGGVMPRIIFGLPLADGAVPDDLEGFLEDIERAVLFEGFAFERPARAEGRKLLVEIFGRHGIPITWVAADEVSGNADRSVMLGDFMISAAGMLCDKAGI